MLADSEREAVADLLGYLENVQALNYIHYLRDSTHVYTQRADTDFFSGPPLQALSTLVYSDNMDLQRSAALTFAEITERGQSACLCCMCRCLQTVYADVREVDEQTLDPILFLLQNPDIEVQRAASAALGNLAVNST